MLVMLAPFCGTQPLTTESTAGSRGWTHCRGTWLSTCWRACGRLGLCSVHVCTFLGITRAEGGPGPVLCK